MLGIFFRKARQEAEKKRIHAERTKAYTQSHQTVMELLEACDFKKKVLKQTIRKRIFAKDKGKACWAIFDATPDIHEFDLRTQSMRLTRGVRLVFSNWDYPAKDGMATLSYRVVYNNVTNTVSMSVSDLEDMTVASNLKDLIEKAVKDSKALNYSFDVCYDIGEKSEP